MKIYLVGIAGYPNYGDELIMKNWVYILRKRYPNAEIWVDVPEPAIISCLFKDENIHVTNAIWRLIWSADNYDDRLSEYFIFLREKIVNLSTPNIDIPIKNLWDVDFYHIVGGGFINTNWAKNIGVILIGVILKIEKNAKVYGTGGGFNPIDKKYLESIKNYLHQFDYIESRDTEGANLLEVKKSFDDAYLMGVSTIGAYPIDEIPDVMICVQRDLISESNFLNIISLLHNRIIEHQLNGLKVGYIEAIPGENLDRLAYEILNENIGSIKFFSALDSIVNGLPIKKNQIWYSTRFHHHLIASYNGCKGVCISINEDYYDVKHLSLLENGTGWSMKSMKSEGLPYPQINENYVINFKFIVEEKREILNDIYPILEENGWFDKFTKLIYKTRISDKK